MNLHCIKDLNKFDKSKWGDILQSGKNADNMKTT